MLREALAPRGAPIAPCMLAALTALVAALGGCSQEGTTPQCEDNVTKDGIQIKNKDGVPFSQVDPNDPTKQPCTAFGKCYVGGNVVGALQCCCPSFSYTDSNTGELVEFAVENGACVNQQTNEALAADNTSLRACLYGYGEVDLDPSGGAGAAGGSGGSGGSGGAGGSGGG